MSALNKMLTLPWRPNELFIVGLQKTSFILMTWWVSCQHHISPSSKGHWLGCGKLCSSGSHYTLVTLQTYQSYVSRPRCVSVCCVSLCYVSLCYLTLLTLLPYTNFSPRQAQITGQEPSPLWTGQDATASEFRQQYLSCFLVGCLVSWDIVSFTQPHCCLFFYVFSYVRFYNSSWTS